MKKENLDRIGVPGSVFAALCCIGTPPLLAFLSAIGLGFLINDLILFPMLAIFLYFTWYGLNESKERHGRKEPLIIFGISVALIWITVWFAAIGVVIGIFGIIGSTILNITFQRKFAAVCVKEGG